MGGSKMVDLYSGGPIKYNNDCNCSQCLLFSILREIHEYNQGVDQKKGNVLSSNHSVTRERQMKVNVTLI